jgi:protein SCO1/2
MIGGLLRVLVIALVLLVGAMVWLNRIGHSDDVSLGAATRLPEPKTLPSVALTDAAGVPLASDALFRDRLSLVFFGFTHCPDICPTTLRQLADLRAALLARQQASPEIVFISVDPTRDTPARISEYLALFDSTLRGATADPAALAPLLQSLGVAVHTEHRPGQPHYTVTHSTAIFVLDPDGRLAAVFSGAHTLDELVADVSRLQHLYRQRLRQSTGTA